MCMLVAQGALTLEREGGGGRITMPLYRTSVPSGIPSTSSTLKSGICMRPVQNLSRKDRTVESRGLTRKLRGMSVSCMSLIRLHLKFARLAKDGRIRESLFETATYAPIASIAIAALRCDERGANHIQGSGNAWVRHYTA